MNRQRKRNKPSKVTTTAFHSQWMEWKKALNKRLTVINNKLDKLLESSGSQENLKDLAAAGNKLSAETDRLNTAVEENK